MRLPAPDGLALYVLIGLATGYAALAVESVYLHRGLTHGGLRFSRTGHLVFRAATWLFIGTTPQKWVAVHRMHHRFSDTDQDPHSPYNVGVTRILVASAVYYARAASTTAELERYARGCEPDELDRRLFRYGGAGLGLFYLGLAGILGWGPAAVAFLVHAGFYYVVQGFLNGLCHWSLRENRRPTTMNRPWFALLTVGESLHDNHHDVPQSPSLGRKPWELDPGWALARVGIALGLVGVTTAGERALRQVATAPTRASRPVS